MSSLVKKTGTFSLAAMLVLLMAAPLSARGAEVTRGSMEPFAAGTDHADYGDVEGKASMIRTASGMTIVVVTASGLIPGERMGPMSTNRLVTTGTPEGTTALGSLCPAAPWTARRYGPAHSPPTPRAAPSDGPSLEPPPDRLR